MPPPGRTTRAISAAASRTATLTLLVGPQASRKPIKACESGPRSMEFTPAPTATHGKMALIKRALRIGESKKFKEFDKRVGRINDFEPEVELDTDDELRERADHLRERARNGEDLDALLAESFAITREAAKRTIGQRHFDVQLIGGMG